MSGVRLVSVCVALAAISIWGGAVFSQWQDNQDRRELAAAKAAPGSEVAEAEGKSALEQADELAMAATREFSKLTEGLTEGLADFSIEMPSVTKAHAETPAVEVRETKSVAGGIELPLMKNAPQGEIKLARLEPAVKGAAIAGDAAAVEETAQEKAERHDEATADMKEAVETLAAITGEDKAAAKTRITELTAKSLVQSAKETPTLNIAPWAVPTGATPDYDESKAIRVGARPWSVPDAADPSYPKVGEKIAEMAEGVTDKAADATSSMGNSLTSLATGVKSIVSGKRWAVPDANDPDYVSQERLADNDGRWQVPNGAQPEYELKDQGRLIANNDAGNDIVHHGRGDKLAFVFEDKEKNQRKLAYYSDPVEESAELNISDKIEARLSDVSEAIETALAEEEPVIIKDMSRLPKDRIAVPVDKYASLEMDDGRPVYTKGRVITVAEVTGDMGDKTEAKLSDASPAAPVVAYEVETQADKGEAQEQKPATDEIAAAKDKAGAEDAEMALADKSATKPNEDEIVIAADEATGALVKEAEKLSAGNNDSDKPLKGAAELNEVAAGATAEKTAPRKDAPEGRAFELAEGAEAQSSDKAEVAEKTANVAERSETAVAEEAVKTDDSQVTEVKTPEVEASAEVAEVKKPIWQVPDAADPEYAVVAQIERGLEKVKDAALEAGNGIAETVGRLQANMKEAVAAEKPWEVPTGVTWGDEGGEELKPAAEVAVAKAEVPAAKVEEAPAGEAVAEDKAALKTEASDTTEKADKLEKAEQTEQAAVEVAALTKAETPADEETSREVLEKQDAETKIFVSAKLQPVGVAPDMKGVAKSDHVTALVESSADKNETVVSSVKHMIASLRDKLTGKEPVEEEHGDVSRIEEVRFAALKTLMVDQIDYELINAKEGKGRLRVAGRSQPDAKLAIYIDIDYIGDAEPDAEGRWSLSKDLYLSQGGHIVRAEQMSDSGLMLVQKTVQFAQSKSLQKPADYKADTVGLGLGDKALAVMREKLKQEQTGIAPIIRNANEIPVGDKIGKISDVGTIVDLPLPVRKVELKKSEDRLADEKTQKQASLTSAVIVSENEKSSSVVAAETPEKSVTAIEVEEPLVKSSVKPESVEKVEEAVAPAKEAADKDAAAIETSGAEQPAKIDEAQSAVPQMTVYEVKPGDTLAKIAQTVYGDAKRYKELLELNPELKSANLIYPKQKLKVREAETEAETVAETAVVEPVKVAALDDSFLPIRKLQEPKVKAEAEAVQAAEKPAETIEAAGEKETAEKPLPEKTSAEFYTVRSGDNLWKIAKRVYGDGERYKEIIDLNPLLKNNPGVIKPQVKLRVKAA